MQGIIGVNTFGVGSGHCIIVIVDFIGENKPKRSTLAEKETDLPFVDRVYVSLYLISKGYSIHRSTSSLYVFEYSTDLIDEFRSTSLDEMREHVNNLHETIKLKKETIAETILLCSTREDLIYMYQKFSDKIIEE